MFSDLRVRFRPNRPQVVFGAGKARAPRLGSGCAAIDGIESVVQVVEPLSGEVSIPTLMLS